VVLTGGPGGGKSSLRGPIAAALQDSAPHVLLAPEAARLVLETGLPVTETTREPFQRAVMQLQAHLRTALTSLAQTLGGDVVVIFDRAEPDGAAYLPDATYRRLLSELGLTAAQAVQQYDVVLHLQSAAVGAQGHYANDDVRTESADVAVRLDEAVLQAWSEHPRRLVIPACDSFEEKAQRVIDAAAAALRGSH
jgi:predicted ATPase